MYQETKTVASMTIKPYGVIDVVGVITITKDDVAISTNYTKHTLAVNDVKADEVLGVGTYWRGVAQYAWDNLPTN